jgi:2-C-methyl-D-erythritol 4-phosphate cytidylyltransferase
LAQHPVGGLLAVPVRDTMKRVATNELVVVATVNREGLWHALTPQMFRLELLIQALQQVIRRGEVVTDEAQAIEQLGYAPIIVEGRMDNIKITHPQDLTLAEFYLQQQN